MTLSPADDAALNAAVADLRAWDARDALEAKAGGRRNARIAQVPDNLARIADAHEARELPLVLAHYPYAEDLDFYEYAVIQAGFAGLEDAREARLAVVALLTRLRAEASQADRLAKGGRAE